MTLDDFLRRSKYLKEKSNLKKEGVLLVGADDFEDMFEVKLNKFLLENELIRSDFFICSLFIASLLSETAFSVPESWYAIDYFTENFESENPISLLKGANTCFLLSTLFPQRCEHRSMKRDDYVHLGSGFYSRFYEKTGKEVTFYMSRLFEPMSIAASTCIEEMQLK